MESIESILAGMGIPADAERETWEGVIQKTRKLGQLILEHFGDKSPRELYPNPIVLPRGGYFQFNILSRAFGYSSTDALHMSLSSYHQGETKRQPNFTYGQMPSVEEIGGRPSIVFDEVCDSGWTLAETTRILTEELGSPEVVTAVLHYK